MNHIIPLKDPIFNKAYILKPGFRYQALRPHCKEIVYCTDGFQMGLDDISTQLVEGFSNFDPYQDCVIPSGSSVVNLLAGYLLAQNHPGEEIVLGIFVGDGIDASGRRVAEHYDFYKLELAELVTTVPF